MYFQLEEAKRCEGSSRRELAPKGPPLRSHGRDKARGALRPAGDTLIAFPCRKRRKRCSLSRQRDKQLLWQVCPERRLDVIRRVG